MQNPMTPTAKTDEGKNLELKIAEAVIKSGHKTRKSWVGKNLSFSASMVSQHTNGIRPISLEAAVEYAKVLNSPLRDISQRIANLLADLPRDQLVCRTTPAVSEPPATYNITTLPTKANPLLEQLVATAAQLSPAGLERLVGYADGLLGQYPQAKQNHAN